MWILPSRGRPPNIARLLKAWEATKADTPAWLRLDDDDPALPQYAAMAIPEGWVRVVGPSGPLATLYNEVYQQAGKRPWWGFIADDVVPETPGWDRILIAVAGSDGMAAPSGGHDLNGAPHFVLGGDLVDSVGWLALPGLDRLYIDTVWRTIAEARGVLRRVPEVTLAHHHFSNGKALFDRTYRKTRKDQDRGIFEAWRKENL